jgi:hypothetical protein
MFFMRYQFLLFSTLLISTIAFPLVVKADTNADIIRKNNEDLGRYQDQVNRNNTQKDINFIIAEYKAMDRRSSAASNQNVHSEVVKIKITGKIATVRVRVTAIAEYSTSGGMVEDTWRRDNNGWKFVTNRILSSNTTVNKPQLNPTGQAQSSHDVIQASHLADQAIRGCYQQKELEECDKLRRIESTLSNWCKQGDQNACGIWSSVMSREESTSFDEMNKK